MHGELPYRFRKGANDPFEATPSLADRLRIQTLSVKIAQHDERRREVLNGTGGRLAPQFDKRGLQCETVCRPLLAFGKKRPAKQIHRTEEFLAQPAEQRRPLDRVQICQPVDPCQSHRGGVDVSPAGRQLEARGFDQRCSAADKGVQHDSIARCVCRQQPFDELRRELSGPRERIGPCPFSNVEGAIGKRRPVQGSCGEIVVQDHGGETIFEASNLPLVGISILCLTSS